MVTNNFIARQTGDAKPKSGAHLHPCSVYLEPPLADPAYVSSQARREPQRGPGNHYCRGPITTLKFRMRREGGNVGRVSPHHPTKGLGSVVKLPVGSGAEPRLKMDFMYISGQKEAIWNTLSVF